MPRKQRTRVASARGARRRDARDAARRRALPFLGAAAAVAAAGVGAYVWWRSTRCLRDDEAFGAERFEDEPVGPADDALLDAPPSEARFLARARVLPSRPPPSE
jgi:hypothetical protein